MKKYVCTVCGYIAEGEIPAQCPVCKAPASAFVEKTGTTLRENGLQVVTEFMPISARFIANKASYQFKHRQMDTMLEKLRDTLHKQEEEK